jgi:hypothetical protein
VLLCILKKLQLKMINKKKYVFLMSNNMRTI